MTTEEFYDRFEFNPSMSGSLLGRGGFSSVHKVYDKVRKRYVAMKRSEVGAFSKFDLEREVKVANEIDVHPNIIRYENVYRISDRAGTFDYAIMKYYAEGNLDNVLVRHQLSDTEKQQILKGILKGLAHLHQVPIIHRDFKAANVLMDRNTDGTWLPVIADFGLSRLIDADKTFVVDNSQIAVTPSYASPEQLLDKQAIRPNADLWAFGVMTYKIVTGRLPFNTEGSSGEWDASSKMRGLILSGTLPQDINSIGEPFQTIITKCLIVNPEVRVKRAEELLSIIEKEPQPKENKKKSTPPPPPPIPNLYDGRTQVIPPIQEIKEVPPPETPKRDEVIESTPTKRWPWEKAFLALAVIFTFGIFWWIWNKQKEPTPLLTPKVTVDTVSKVNSITLPSKDTLKTLPQPINSGSLPKKVVSPSLPQPQNSLSYGYLVIYTSTYSFKVYIDNELQPSTAEIGRKNIYKIPTGEGRLFRLENTNGIGVPEGGKGAITVRSGQSYEKRFD